MTYCSESGLKYVNYDKRETRGALAFVWAEEEEKCLSLKSTARYPPELACLRFQKVLSSLRSARRACLSTGQIKVVAAKLRLLEGPISNW